VSSLYVARSDAGRRAVDDLSGQPLLAPRPGQPVVEVNHVDWHHRQVFKGAGVEAA
jgi:putative restriction endonuclease